jgi:hypothetical protein
MALPLTNTTCDIYRNSNSPPSAPDVAGVACYFKPVTRNMFNMNTGAQAGFADHLLLVPPTTDIRDGWATNTPSPGAGTAPDKVYIPNKNSSVVYVVAEVQRVGLGTALDHKRVYLLRQSVTYPTNDL